MAVDDYPLGRALSVDHLTEAPYGALEQLRHHEPVSWIPALNGWLVTRRDLGLAAMRDAESFTVDDPRFSTAAVLGPSMLSLEGAEHARHRNAFAPRFRPKVVRAQCEAWLESETERLAVELARRGGPAELRTEYAGPVAVGTITRFLGLEDVDAAEVLSWYYDISAAIEAVTLGQSIAPTGHAAVARLRERVIATIDGSGQSLVKAVSNEGRLQSEEMVSEVAVIMFGAIETSEGMTANVLWHLLNRPEVLREVAADRSLVGPAIEESLRLEPAAAVIDRYATADVEFGGARIAKGDLVTISLLGCNRDPEMFVSPDHYDLHRDNTHHHLAFVQGPHACIGLHLARLETATAVNALLDHMDRARFDSEASQPPSGLIFRKPSTITVHFEGGTT